MLELSTKNGHGLCWVRTRKFHFVPTANQSGGEGSWMAFVDNFNIFPARRNFVRLCNRVMSSHDNNGSFSICWVQ